MRSSWNFSTAILEIWVLVLTKPGWANETPTTSLRVPPEYENHRHHHLHVQHQHYYHQPEPYYPVSESRSEDLSSSSSRNSNNHLFHSSHYYANSHNNNNRHNQHHYLSHHHHPHLHHHRRNNRHNLVDSASSLGNEPIALASSSFYSSPYDVHNHRCYVCLPPNKNSREAQQILDIFAEEMRPLIPDCKDFDPYVDTARFEFDCPPRYFGCLLRIHGSNVSRACSRHRVNDCKKASSVEFCYCTTPLCNDKKPEPLIIPPAIIQHVSRNVGDGNSRRRGSNSSSNNKSSLHGRTSGDEFDEGGNSQGIRARVSSSSVDDEDILHHHTEVEDDDEDINGGSGTGSSDDDQDEHNHHINSYIDPSLTSTIDPSIFHEENGGSVVDVEDPNPHTKIGISMTASTSSSSGGSSSLKWNSFTLETATFVGSSVFHLFLYLVQRTLLLDRLFPDDSQVVDYQSQLELQDKTVSNYSSDTHTSIGCKTTYYGRGGCCCEAVRDCHHYNQHHHLNRLEEVVGTRGSEDVISSLYAPFHFTNLCFIISLLLVAQVLFS